MPQNPDPCALHRALPGRHQAGPAQARLLRASLSDFARRAAEGTLPLQIASPTGALIAGGAGHFHLGAELFLQIGGHTEFSFPNGRLRLDAGAALVVPAKVLHDEHVQADGPGAAEAFANIVVYAEAGQLSCHLAHEQQPGRPGILHLEARRHAQAARLQDWLADAARLGGSPDSPWAEAQARALVCAAITGVLRCLDESPADPAQPPEPALLARARMLIQNQLGDQQLSVRRLAEQCGCTADHLSHLFSRHGGEHLAALINRLRMERAARLLLESELSGKEIAWACGFAGPSYFIRTFRQHYGTTPQAFRADVATSAPA
ncbi:MAG: hypothetical protein RJA44_40 [Pseudomonadota bacterium]|jgi:AraC-like DNA-binding protein